MKLNIDEDKNNMLNKIDNLNNDIQNTINNTMKNKIEELEKKSKVKQSYDIG